MIQVNHTYTIFFTTELAGVATAADSTPTATLYRNGSASGVTVTVAATATTGLYKATFTTDAGWSVDDVLHLTVSATIDSTSGYVGVVWDSTGDVDAVMRGTDSSLTSLGATAPANWIDAAAIAADAGAEIAALVESYIVDEGDATAVLQAVADKIAADWVAGDASPLAIVAAIKADGTISTALGNMDAAVSDTATASALSDVEDKVDDVLEDTGTTLPGTLSTIEGKVDTVDTNVDTLLSRVTSTVATLWANLTAMITGSDASAAWTETAMENVSCEGGGSGLTGPYTRTITVTDSDTDATIENAKVRLYKTGSTETKLTNASGVVTFTTEAATWSYSVTATGYGGATGTIVISADGSTAIELDAVASTAPSDPSLCAVTIEIRDQYGAVLADEPVEITWVKWADAASDTPLVLSVPPVQTTDSNGQVVVDLLRLGEYRVTYGNSDYARRIDVEVPDAGTYAVEI